MTIKDLINNKNVGYFEFGHDCPKKLKNVQIFMRPCKKNYGKLISLDEDNYLEEDDVELKKGNK